MTQTYQPKNYAAVWQGQRVHVTSETQTVDGPQVHIEGPGGFGRNVPKAEIRRLSARGTFHAG